MESTGMQRFEGTESYIATEDLRVAVNAAIALQRPLLVKGEPGTGKTILAHEIAKALGKDIITWHIKSTTKAQQGLYEYDAVARLRDSQLGDSRVQDIRNYIQRGKLWEAFTGDTAPVLLIDEIDKADIEFPNDLLLELDRMEFYVYETRETVVAQHRPFVRDERFPHLTAHDVVRDVLHPRIAELPVAQALHRVIFIEAVLRLGGRLHVPFDERRVERRGDLARQHGLAGAGLALHQQGALEGDRSIDRHLEVVGRHIGFGTVKSHENSRFVPVEGGLGILSRIDRRT